MENIVTGLWSLIYVAYVHVIIYRTQWKNLIRSHRRRNSCGHMAQRGLTGERCLPHNVTSLARIQIRTPYPTTLPTSPTIWKFYTLSLTAIYFIGALAVRKKKRWAHYQACFILFTSATTRPIHLERVPNIVSQNFLNFFRGLTSRQDLPQLILGDN